MSTSMQNAGAIAHTAHGGARPAKWWIYLLLGIVFLAMGGFVFANLMAATIVSAIFLGAALLVTGGFQVVHAFYERSWGGFFLSLLMGLLYLAAGVVMLINPVAGSLAVTLAIAAMLIASGVMRLVLAFRMQPSARWILALSGVIAILLGAMILLGWPASGLVALGIFLGVDLMFFGWWWIAFAVALRSGALKLS